MRHPIPSRLSNRKELLVFLRAPLSYTELFPWITLVELDQGDVNVKEHAGKDNRDKREGEELPLRLERLNRLQNRPVSWQRRCNQNPREGHKDHYRQKRPEYQVLAEVTGYAGENAAHRFSVVKGT